MAARSSSARYGPRVYFRFASALLMVAAGTLVRAPVFTTLPSDRRAARPGLAYLRHSPSGSIAVVPAPGPARSCPVRGRGERLLQTEFRYSATANMYFGDRRCLAGQLAQPRGAGRV